MRDEIRAVHGCRAKLKHMQHSARLVIAITRGLIRSQRTRRMTMFVMVMIALVLLFCGATFLSGLLAEHPFAFVIYWAVCAWLTLCAVLLAIFDMLAVRAMALRERRRLKEEIFRARDKNDV